MFLDTMAQDWEITSVGDISAVAGVGVGGQHFAFRSREVGHNMNFVMFRGAVGGELGAEGRAAPIFSQLRRLLPLLEASDDGYERLQCIRPFCFRDLMWGTAELRSATISVGGGATREILSMRASGLGPNSGAWIFRNHDMPGDTVGLGIGVSVTLGAMIPLAWSAYSRWAEDLYRQFLDSDPQPNPHQPAGRPGRRF